MRQAGKHTLKQFQKRWQLFIAIEIILYASGITLLVFAIGKNWAAAIFSFLVVSLLLLVIKKPWQFTVQRASQFIDNTLKSAENSTELLLIPEEDLSNLAVLQRFKVTERLESEINQVQPKIHIKRAFLMLLLCMALGVVLHYLNVFQKSGVESISPVGKETLVFQAVDSSKVQHKLPVISEQKLRIDYPDYTKLPTRTTSDMNVKALEGSRVRWNISFDKEVDSVFLEIESFENSMQRVKNTYTSNRTLKQSSFYNFKFKDQDGILYLSDLYALEVVKDEVPKVEIQNLKQFSTFEIGNDKLLKFSALLSDDFGIADAYIIATVTKGEGESVKFREERLAFDSGFESGGKKLNLTKTINLDALQMEAGDELYFYIEGIDVKQPKANRSRSETFFAVIRDTVTGQFAVEGTMGADLMPDYFRSQRQLIIDTEKLIASKNKLSKGEFNATSNELGYDQKALRLKYGEFMGDEADSGIQVTREIDMEENTDENDPLEEYTHDHDGSNEHNLVDHEHEEESPTDGEENPLEEYLHNHDDPEESTLFTQSLKGKLRQAMAEMWDAELHLRLYTPENSLPYQYRALKLIQEIKNSARIYVHRIGFDPPPIKEDKRLTGDIQEVNTFQKSDEVVLEDNFKAMRKSVSRISEILMTKSTSNQEDKVLFAAAGNELAILAIQNPGKHLNTLQQLKLLSESEQISNRAMRKVQLGLLVALPDLSVNPFKTAVYEDGINELMLKELEIND